MKYTAVQILISEFKNYLPSIHQQGLIDKFEQALQLEKQQIIDAYEQGDADSYLMPENIDAENYYRNKFER